MKHKDQKRIEARERQAEYDKLTTQEKLDCLNAVNPTGARRQRARLEDQLLGKLFKRNGKRSKK